MNEGPLVSVLIPVYNGGKFILGALESITNQTYNNLEIVVINDGSTDNTVELIETLKDKRIKLVHNEKNIGLIGTLNKGVDFCSGEFIARMDADDFSFPTRIEKQVKLMLSQPETGFCGTWFETYNNEQLISKSSYPSDNDAIQLSQLFKMSLCHGTALFRKELLLENRFDPSFAHAEDQELWSRLKNKAKMANIPEVLYKVVQHGENVSKKFNQVQLNNTDLVFINQLKELLNEEVSLELMKTWRAFCFSNFELSKEETITVGELLRKLNKNRDKLNLNTPSSFTHFYNEKWNIHCFQNSKRIKGIYSIWKRYSLIKPSFLQQLKLKIKQFI